MSDVDMITLSSEDAAARLDELLDEASGNPIGITGRDDLMAYLVLNFANDNPHTKQISEKTLKFKLALVLIRSSFT